MIRIGPRYVFLVLAWSGISAAGPAAWCDSRTPEGVPLATGRRITPQGRQTGVGSFPANMVMSPDARFLAVTDTGFREFVSVLSVEDGRLISQIEAKGRRRDGSKKKRGLYYGLAFGPATEQGKARLYVSRGAADRISLFTLDSAGKLADMKEYLDDPSGVAGFKSPHHVAGLALNRDGSRLYAVNNNTGPLTDQKGSLSILDTASRKVVATVPLPGFPYAIAALTNGPGADRKVYVSSERDGIVSVVDLDAAQVVKDVPTGDHPMALLLDRAGGRLFVANAGSDTVSIVDTASDTVASTILLRPEDARGLPGATPTGLALAPDESRLYVTLADMNAVAVVALPEGRVEGYIPVGWYPTAVVASPDGRRLFVSNAKGDAARHPNDKAAGPHGRWGRYIQNIIEGTVSMLDVPGRDELERLTAQTLANNAAMGAGPGVPFANPGIRHVIYIVKENRTYDQVLGDLLEGDGDPKLCLFPREVTPNLHALAERFVLLDNFYVSGEVSGDGWNWSVSGMASEYTERNTPYNYSGRGRGYDSEGRINGFPVDLYGIPDVSRAPGGYIWDQLAKHGVSYRNYGFFVDPGDERINGVPVSPSGGREAADRKALVAETDKDFRWFDLDYADSDAWRTHDALAPKQLKSHGAYHDPSRFAAWKREFDGYMKGGDLPGFMMVRFGRDHTAGTKTGSSSPRAMVADNDYAVGELVQAVSESPYWKDTAIFVIEDDAQDGFDHVEAHRSTAYVISPYVRQGTVDHRFYNTDSVLHTMELLLGADPMSQYDASAPPLDVFGGRPDNDGYYAAILPGREIIAEVNGRTTYRAGDSDRLPFEVADAVPDEVLNDILWHAIKGCDAPEPAVRHGLRLSPDD